MMYSFTDSKQRKYKDTWESLIPGSLFDQKVFFSLMSLKKEIKLRKF